MKLLPESLSLRLAWMFAFSSVLILGVISLYLYQSLYKEVAWRDDQALAGRIERMRVLIDDSESIAALRSRPQLYGNMLGNSDNMLWIVDDSGKPQIEINPLKLSVPVLQAETSGVHWHTVNHDAPVRIASMRVEGSQGAWTLIAGKLLTERSQMMRAYRLKLWLALGAGGLLAFALGVLISVRGMRPVRQLAKQAAAIDVQHLHVRLSDTSEASELRDLHAALNQMLARLEAGFIQLSRFSEDLAHEMRTPLGNLMGETQHALGQSRSIEAYQELLSSNQEEYERLARMIDNMLLLARTEQAAASVKRETFDLQELVEQLCDYFEGMSEERAMPLLNRAHGSIQADPDLLRRALANLLANALRYGDAGKPVGIDSVVRADTVEISVCNFGNAIAPEHLPFLFERFYRCDASRNQPGDSGGLGLAIVRSIVQLHGGNVTVQSDEQETRFVITLPLHSDELQRT